MTRTRFLLTSLAVTIVLFSATAAHTQNKAPDGAILISQSTILGGLAEDAFGFPITIARPGLYRLTSNIVVPDADTTAIEITANHVTLDLNGFAILGPVECFAAPSNPMSRCSPAQGKGEGVSQRLLSVRNTTVRNGTVNGMGSNGIVLSSKGSRVEGIHASHNGGDGIFVAHSGVVLHNTATFNGGGGIRGNLMIMLGNVVVGNGGNGFEFGPGAGVGQNVSILNGDNSIAGGHQTDGNVCGNALCP